MNKERLAQEEQSERIKEQAAREALRRRAVLEEEVRQATATASDRWNPSTLQEELRRMGGVGVGGTAARLAERMGAARDASDALWEAFEAQCDIAAAGSVPLSAVPFPPELNSLQVCPLENSETVIGLYKKALLRWHPDKFLAKFSEKMAAGDKGPLKERLAEAFGGIQKAREAARGAAGAAGYAPGLRS